MDLRLSAEDLAFRDELRAFLRASLPAPLARRLRTGGKASPEELRAWTRTLADRGWSVPHWPVEWGGTGWSPLRQMIFRDEVQQFPAPEPLSFGASMVGPVIYTFGSQAQKERFLPRIARLDDWWCQGFSEPEAGSDLASLRTSACVFTHRYSSARAFVDFFRAHFGLRYARSRPGRNGTCAISRLQPANEAS